MAKKTNPLAGSLKNLIGGKGNNKKAKTPAARGIARGAQTEDAAIQKLTRLELLEILVDQRKEIDLLQEKLADAQKRLERDDALIRKFIGRDHTEFKVRREVKDE